MSLFNLDRLRAIRPSQLKVLRSNSRYTDYNCFTGVHQFFMKYTNEKIADQITNYIVAFRSATVANNRSEIF